MNRRLPAERVAEMETAQAITLPRPHCVCGYALFSGYTRCPQCDRVWDARQKAMNALWEIANGARQGRDPARPSAYVLGALGGVQAAKYETLMERVGVEPYGAHWRWKDRPDAPLLLGEHVRVAAVSRADAAARERADAPKDDEGYPVERGIPLPVHPHLLP